MIEQRADGENLLGSLLDEELSYEATTSRGLTNHLPMALVAKHGLGAPQDELRRFATRYETTLIARGDADAALTVATWRGAIGQRGSFDDLVIYFGAAIDEHGVDATLRSHLDDLIPGIYGAAFHGAIRLAYALEVGSPSRVAAGLAYLAESAVSIGEPLPPRPTTAQPFDVLCDLSASRAFVNPSNRELISDEMADVGANPQFWRLVAGCDINDATQGLLREAALHLFATTGDFTSLHAVTGMEALASLRTFAADQARFDLACLSGVAAAYATIGAPALLATDQLNEWRATTLVDTETIMFVGAMSDDEHVAKLIYSARRLFELTGDTLYLYVAARKAGLDTSTRS